MLGLALLQLVTDQPRQEQWPQVSSLSVTPPFLTVLYRTVAKLNLSLLCPVTQDTQLTAQRSGCSENYQMPSEAVCGKGQEGTYRSV